MLDLLVRMMVKTACDLEDSLFMLVEATVLALFPDQVELSEIYSIKLEKKYPRPPSPPFYSLAPSSPVRQYKYFSIDPPANTHL